MSEQDGREDARCPNCDNESILELHCEHCGYGLDALEESQTDGAIDRWFDPAMYALGTFVGAGLLTMVAEVPRFQTMATWKVGMFAVLGIIMWGAGVHGLYAWGDDDGQ